jgi:hypothetical protein
VLIESVYFICIACTAKVPYRWTIINVRQRINALYNFKRVSFEIKFRNLSMTLNCLLIFLQIYNKSWYNQIKLLYKIHPLEQLITSHIYYLTQVRLLLVYSWLCCVFCIYILLIYTLNLWTQIITTRQIGM